LRVRSIAGENDVYCAVTGQEKMLWIWLPGWLVDDGIGSIAGMGG